MLYAILRHSCCNSIEALSCAPNNEQLISPCAWSYDISEANKHLPVSWTNYLSWDIRLTFGIYTISCHGAHQIQRTL